MAPRIRELKARQNELEKTRVQIEANIVAQGVEEVDLSLVKSYAEGLRSLLGESGFAESKAFLRLFVERIEVNEGVVTIHYKLPLPPMGKSKESYRFCLSYTMVELRYQ